MAAATQRHLGAGGGQQRCAQAFTTDPNIPFDNNLAERDNPMAKIRQKISGCLRTLTGAEHLATIRSYTATASKNNINMYQALVQLADGNPWLPQTT